MAKKPQHAQNNQRSQQGKQGQQQKRGGKAQATVASTKHSQATPARPWRPGRDKFLPVSRADMDARGWDQCDFVYICGDAYVDHPSFGMAIISRVLDAHGYKVGIICQPDWTDPASITALGEPRLGFLVSAGNMDSMVNHYSVTKHRRHTDAYTPGGEEGHRPNRAVTVYGNLIRQTFKDAPIIIGGIEASLRRLAHYDYWQDKLKRSVLLDSGADILIYGMGEHAIVEIADALDAGLPIDQITYINGTVYRTGSLDEVYDYDLLPSWDDLVADKLNYARSFNVQQQNMDPITGHRLVEPYPNNVYVVQNPPSSARRDGRGGRTPLRTRLASRLRRGGRRAGLCRDQVFDQLQPRLFWRVLVLRPHLPPGPRVADAQPRLDHARGRAAHARSRV